tara:strand:+ start:101 stop:475 length:375 start_codon:yes stop_codon:yes gene_type:complete
MNLVFGMDGVICTPCHDYVDVERAKPITNVREFLIWLKRQGHHITIWCKRPNSLDWVMATKEWCSENGIWYDRLLFDRPFNPIYVSEAPPNCKYYKHHADLGIIAEMFEEWKRDARDEWTDSES